MDLNDTQNFSAATSPASFKTDVQNTVTHELGHAIGLAHSPVVEATMYYQQTSSGEITKRDLAADDIDAICTLYATGTVTPGSGTSVGKVRSCSIIDTAATQRGWFWSFNMTFMPLLVALSLP